MIDGKYVKLGTETKIQMALIFLNLVLAIVYSGLFSYSLAGDTSGASAALKTIVILLSLFCLCGFFWHCGATVSAFSRFTKARKRDFREYRKEMHGKKANEQEAERSRKEAEGR